MEDPMEDMDPMEDPMEEDCTLACQATEGRTARPSCLPASVCSFRQIEWCVWV